ncbi:MAG: hypothetical protein IJ637_00020 [Prevotella sp.]|nr:hypothetical protein [Prevotella sp.]
MKKIIVAVMAVAAISFTSCGNKTQQAEAVDSVAIVDSLAGSAAQGIIDELKAQVEAADVTKLQDALVAAKDKVVELVKENPEVAREYVVKVQSYLKENAEQVKAVVGENAAAAAALSAITEVEPATIVSGLLESVGNAAVDTKDAAVDAAASKVEAGQAAAQQAATNLKDAAQQTVDGAKAAAKQTVDDAKAAAQQKAAAAQAAAQQKAAESKQKTGEAIDNAAAAAKQKLGL